MNEHDIPQHGVLEHPNMSSLVGWMIHLVFTQTKLTRTKNGHLVHLATWIPVVSGMRWDLVGVPASMTKKPLVLAASEAGQVVRDEHALSYPLVNSHN